MKEVISGVIFVACWVAGLVFFIQFGLAWQRHDVEAMLGYGFSIMFVNFCLLFAHLSGPR